MPVPNCHIHGCRLEPQPQRPGTSGRPYWECPRNECSVGWWGNEANTPADQPTREARAKLYRFIRDRLPVLADDYGEEALPYYLPDGPIGRMQLDDIASYLSDLLDDFPDAESEVAGVFGRELIAEWTGDRSMQSAGMEHWGTAVVRTTLLIHGMTVRRTKNVFNFVACRRPLVQSPQQPTPSEGGPRDLQPIMTVASRRDLPDPAGFRPEWVVAISDDQTFARWDGRMWLFATREGLLRGPAEWRAIDEQLAFHRLLANDEPIRSGDRYRIAPHDGLWVLVPEDWFGHTPGQLRSSIGHPSVEIQRQITAEEANAITERLTGELERMFDQYMQGPHPSDAEAARRDFLRQVSQGLEQEAQAIPTPQPARSFGVVWHNSWADGWHARMPSIVQVRSEDEVREVIARGVPVTQQGQWWGVDGAPCQPEPERPRPRRQFRLE